MGANGSMGDDEILASLGMAMDEVDEIADACERGDYSTWDSSRVSDGSPSEEGATAVIDTADGDRVVSLAEDGTPVTGAMVDEWERAYATGVLPDGYSPDGPASSGRPPLHEGKCRQ